MMPTASSTGRVISVLDLERRGAGQLGAHRQRRVGRGPAAGSSLSRDSDTTPNSAIATVHMTMVTRRRIAKSISFI